MDPESLEQQCLLFIAMNLDKFPTDYLALLPLTTRETIIHSLPIADVCHLEDTAYVAGLDLAEYWKLPCVSTYPYLGITVYDPKDEDMTRYVEECWSDPQVLSKAILYGQVATCAIGCSLEGCCFNYPRNVRPLSRDDKTRIVSFLYAIRKFREHTCELIFPSRYSGVVNSLIEGDWHGIVNAVIKCFQGELPKILTDITLYIDHPGMLKDYAYFLQDLVWVSIFGNFFDPLDESFTFISTVILEARHLEVLILEGSDDSDPTCKRASLDDILLVLSTHSTFLSTFRVLKVSPFEDGHRVSRAIFDQFVTAYFAAPTDHHQNIYFSDLKIVSNAFYDSPDIEPRYQKFKSITLDMCKFASKYEAGHKAISHWLNQDVEVKEIVNEQSNSKCRFYVKTDFDNTQSRKRKFSEI